MASEKKKEKVIKHVIVKARAIDDGYYKNRIIKAGETFSYEGITKDGKYPQWIEAIGTAKVVEPKKAQEKEVDVDSLV